MPGLGRKPFVPDRRDWNVSKLMGIVAAGAVPKVWESHTVLNQRDTPHCVGFGNAGFGNCAPVDDEYDDEDGHLLYYEACAIGGYPGTEDGAFTRDGLKALRARGRITAYAALPDTQAISTWLANMGSVIVGTDWTEAMFTPDAEGFIAPMGETVGGHCYLLIGVDEQEYTFTMLNSWGAGWGQDGRAKIRIEDFHWLLAAGGEAWAAVELPLDAPPPEPTRKPWLLLLWEWLLRLFGKEVKG